MEETINNGICKLCPRECGVDRNAKKGACGAKNEIRIAKIMLHRGEEPCISGRKGSGAIFFSGCALKCVFCQNATISRENAGKIFTENEFIKSIYDLCERGAHNINLVTAGHYLNQIVPVLEKIKHKLPVPVVYNTSAYEKAEQIKRLDGLVDVYLPDYKYFSQELAKKYSSASDYPSVARACIKEMLRQQPQCVFEDGLIKKGVIIRHLVLPTCKNDSLAVIEDIAKNFVGAQISIMRQYTPSFNLSDFPELNRKITSYEYGVVVKRADELDLVGFLQEKGCETDEFTPDFTQIYE